MEKGKTRYICAYAYTYTDSIDLLSGDLAYKIDTKTPSLSYFKHFCNQAEKSPDRDVAHSFIIFT